MEGKRKRMLAGGGITAAILVGATLWMQPAAAAPTVTVYKVPT